MAILEVQSVTKVYGGRSLRWPWHRPIETRALDAFSLKLDPGKIAVILGPNGSGKTTLLKLLSTMLLPDTGRVIIAGNDTQQDEALVRRAVGFAVGSERSFYPRLTARENLRFFATFDDVPHPTLASRVDECLAAVALTPDAGKLVMKFSSGMLHRLGIARAILKRPSLLLLDEPSRSLDPAAAEHLWKMLRGLADSGTTIMVASHNFEEAANLADVVAVLVNGKLAGARSFVPSRDANAVRSFYFSAVTEGALIGAGV